MEKKKLLTVAVAVMLVSVAAIGIWQLWGSEEGYDPGEGVLLSFGEFELEFVTLGERNLTVSQAHDMAMEKINEGTGEETLGAGENWTTLWTVSEGDTGWTENTGDWDELMLKDFKYVSFSKENEKPVFIRDASGELFFSLMGPKDRIVVMSPTIKDIVVALCGKENIRGADQWSHGELGLSNVSNVGGYNAANFSSIVLTNPDLVIVDRGWGEDGISKQLRDAGIPVLGIDSRSSLDVIMNNILNIGYATGSAANAKEITDRMQFISDELSCVELLDDTFGDERPKVLMTMNFFNPGELFLYGTGTPQSNLMEAAGGVNVVTNTGYPMMDRGMIVDNFGEVADIIIMIGMGSGADTNAFINDPVFGTMNASQNGMIFSIDDDAASAINRSGPDIIYTMAIMYIILTETEGGFSFGDDYKDVIRAHEVIGHLFA